MQTKHLCALIHIWTKAEVGAPLNQFEPSSKIFLLAVQGLRFFCGSFVLFLSCFVVLSCASVCWCLVVACCGGWPLGPRLWCLVVTLSLSCWYPGSDVVLDVSISHLCTFSYIKPSSNFITGRFKAVLRSWVLFVICVCACLLWCLFLVALWSPFGKGLSSWLSCVWHFLVLLSLSNTFNLPWRTL